MITLILLLIIPSTIFAMKTEDGVDEDFMKQVFAESPPQPTFTNQRVSSLESSQNPANCIHRLAPLILNTQLTLPAVACATTKKPTVSLDNVQACNEKVLRNFFHFQGRLDEPKSSTEPVKFLSKKKQRSLNIPAQLMVATKDADLFGKLVIKKVKKKNRRKTKK